MRPNDETLVGRDGGLLRIGTVSDRNDEAADDFGRVTPDAVVRGNGSPSVTDADGSALRRGAHVRVAVYSRAMARWLRASAYATLIVGTGLVGGCLFPSLSELECQSNCGGSSGTATTTTGTTGTATTAATGSTVQTGATSSTGTGGGPCVSMEGPAGVSIESINEFPAFCIDSTEVSFSEYAKFLAANIFPLQTLPTNCSWKGTAQAAYVPLAYIWMAYQMDMAGHGDHPVQGLDWCDAATYCAWAGKRLCGSDNPADRHLPVSDIASAQTGEWYRACGGPSGALYPYGSMFDVNACNTPAVHPSMNNPFNTLAVTMPSTCAAVWPGGSVYDQIGNVAEYEDNCIDGSGATPDQDTCYPRGGSYELTGSYNSCGDYESDQLAKRGVKGDYIGFRCCW